MVFLIMASIARASDGQCKFKEFSGADWAFVRATVLADSPPEEKLNSIFTACRELDTTYWAGTFAQHHQGLPEMAGKGVIPFLRLIGYAPAAFIKLNANTLQRDFNKQLEAIRLIRDPILRIQKVYQLVTRFQGEYDSETTGSLPYRRPGAVINKAAKDGVGGQCRDFALLLYWSLLQVARHPDDRRIYGDLGENSFSVSPQFGDGKFDDEYVGFHDWVRVHLAGRDDSYRLYFVRFDLDNTFYPKAFTPLMPRQQNFSERDLAKRKNTCDQLVRCLMRENFHSVFARLHDAVSTSDR